MFPTYSCYFLVRFALPYHSTVSAAEVLARNTAINYLDCERTRCVLSSLRALIVPLLVEATSFASLFLDIRDARGHRSVRGRIGAHAA